MGMLLAFLKAHELAGIFVWGALKAAVPFPSPSVMMIAGALVVPAGAGWLKAAALLCLRIGLPGAAGTTLGSWGYYRLARRRGAEFAERWAPAVGVRRALVLRVERLSGENKALLTFALFAVPVVPLILAAVTAGLAKASGRRFAAGCFAGSLIRGCLLGLAGHLTRQTYAGLSWSGPSAGTELVLVCAGGALLLAIWALRGREQA